MPELFRFFGMKFFFYSMEHLPIHVHVRNADGVAKFEIDPLRLVENKGMKPKDLLLAQQLIQDKKEEIIAKWKHFHGKIK